MIDRETTEKPPRGLRSLLREQASNLFRRRASVDSAPDIALANQNEEEEKLISLGIQGDHVPVDVQLYEKNAPYAERLQKLQEIANQAITQLNVELNDQQTADPTSFKKLMATFLEIKKITDEINSRQALPNRRAESPVQASQYQAEMREFRNQSKVLQPAKEMITKLNTFFVEYIQHAKNLDIPPIEINSHQFGKSNLIQELLQIPQLQEEFPELRNSQAGGIQELPAKLVRRLIQDPTYHDTIMNTFLTVSSRKDNRINYGVLHPPVINFKRQFKLQLIQAVLDALFPQRIKTK